MFEPKPFELTFNPQLDITAYELALILANANIVAQEDALKRLPSECHRHFVYNENSNNTGPDEKNHGND